MQIPIQFLCSGRSQCGMHHCSLHHRPCPSAGGRKATCKDVWIVYEPYHSQEGRGSDLKVGRCMPGHSLDEESLEENVVLVIA